MQQLVDKINTTYVAPTENTKVFKNYNTIDNSHLYVYAKAITYTNIGTELPNSS